MRRILVAVDGSEPSQRAASLAADLAVKLTGELLIMNVVQEGETLDDEMLEFAESEGLGESPIAVLNALGNKAVAEALGRASAAGATHVSSEIASGDPADVILAAARDRAIDLIVVGRTGRGRLANLLLGSVSQEVVNGAPCPVLVVR